MCVCMYVCIGNSRYSIHQIPELYFSQQRFPSKDILLVPHFPVSKNLVEEQILWGTDLLGAPDRGDVQDVKFSTHVGFTGSNARG